jgi:hypothetical protein
MAVARSKAGTKAKPRANAGARPGTKAKPRKRYAAELKTKVNDASVDQFIRAIPDEEQRADSAAVAELFRAATKAPPKMWGTSIVGYDTYHYVGRSGREGDWMVCGFSPRKGTLTLYMLGGWDHDKALLAKVGKHSLGKGCLYLRSLKGIDRGALQRLITASLKRAKTLNTNHMDGAA